MIVLRAPGLILRIDPAHGGEILDLVELSTAIELARGERFRSTIAATPFSAPGSHT